MKISYDGTDLEDLFDALELDENQGLFFWISQIENLLFQWGTVNDWQKSV